MSGLIEAIHARACRAPQFERLATLVYRAMIGLDEELCNEWFIDLAPCSSTAEATIIEDTIEWRPEHKDAFASAFRSWILQFKSEQPNKEHSLVNLVAELHEACGALVARWLLVSAFRRSLRSLLGSRRPLYLGRIDSARDRFFGRIHSVGEPDENFRLRLAPMALGDLWDHFAFSNPDDNQRRVWVDDGEPEGPPMDYIFASPVAQQRCFRRMLEPAAHGFRAWLDEIDADDLENPLDLSEPISTGNDRQDIIDFLRKQAPSASFSSPSAYSLSSKR